MEEQVLCGGKLIVIDFDKLDYRDFGLFADTKEKFLKLPGACGIDGKLYINTRNELCEALTEVMKIYIAETRYNLRRLKRMYQLKYPKIKNWDDFDKMNGTEEQKKEAFFMLMIDTEMDRRKVEKRYFK